MECYAITVRLSAGVNIREKDFLDEIIAQFSKYDGAKVIMEHEPKDHLHGYCFTTQQRDSVRRYFERLLAKHYKKGEDYLQKYAIKIKNVLNKDWSEKYLKKYDTSTVLYHKEWEGEKDYVFRELEIGEEPKDRFEYLKSQIKSLKYGVIFTEVKKIVINEWSGGPRMDQRKKWVSDLWALNNDNYSRETREEMEEIDNPVKIVRKYPKLLGSVNYVHARNGAG